MFQADECIHFVFADRNDNYCCSSGLILSFEKYLYLQLRKAQYRKIFFLRHDAEKWVLEVSEYEKKVFERTAKFLLCQVSSETNAVRELTEILSGSGSYGKEKIAVVMDVENFTALCGSVQEDVRKKLVLAAARRSRTNILVLCCPENADDSHSALFESEVFGAFPDGSSLSQAVLSAKKDEPNPFGQLCRYCRDKGNYLVFNSRVADERDDWLVKEQLKGLADCLRFHHSAWQSPNERDLVNFLYAVMRSRMLRETLKIWQQKFASVYERLSSPEGWSLFLRNLEYWKTEMQADGREDRELIAYLRSSLGDFEEIVGGVELCDDLSASCRDAYLPKWYKEMCYSSGRAEVYMEMEEQLAVVRRKVITPRWGSNEQAKIYLRKYMQYFREEQTFFAARSSTHLENIIRAAVFAASHLETENESENFRDCCQAYDELIRVEQNYNFTCRQGVLSVSDAGNGLYKTTQTATESPDIARRNLAAKLEHFSGSMDPEGVRRKRAADKKNTLKI